MTEQQQFDRIHKIISKINDNLKKIAKMLDLETNLTSYVSRHKDVSINQYVKYYTHLNK